LANPTGTDDGLEWVELFNTSSLSVDLYGFTLKDDGDDSHKITQHVLIAAGSYLIVGQSADFPTNGGAPVGYEYGMNDFLLSNSADEVVIQGPDGVEVDRVNYDEDGGFPGMSGFALSLDPSSFSQWANDSAEAWCDSPAPYFGSNGDHGSPLELNPGCSTWGDDDDSVGDDDDAAGGVDEGDIIFTEIFNNPDGDDLEREWVELLNLTGVSIDLQDYIVEDLGSDYHEISESVIIPPGGYIVLGTTVDPTLNDEAPVDYAWGSGFSLGNGEDEIQLVSPTGIVIDTVVWDNGATFPDPSGAAMSLDLDALDSVSNDVGVNWCESSAGNFSPTGGLGSPGTTNPACGSVVPVDADGDGVPAGQDCDDSNAGLFPGNTEIPCDGYDQDCDGSDLLQDLDGDGVSCDTDCDDGVASVYPGATELPGNGVDDDCDGQVDESAVGCDTTETEPNNGWTAAEPMALDTVMCGVVASAGDADTFELQVPAWTQVTMDVDASVLGSTLDSELYFLGSTGSVLQSNDDDGSTLDSYISTIVVNSGTYYASVGDFNTTGSSTHNYELNVSTDTPCDTVEIEPNGSSTFADYVLLGGMACGIVSGSTDYDNFSFFVQAGTTVDFEILALDVGSSLGAQLVLYDTDGVTELADAEPGGFGDPQLSYTFTATGTYYIEVASDLYFINSSGPYLLNLD
jgi:hypothetical protein